MFTTKELIQDLEISIKALKNGSMLNKPKLAEACVENAMVCIKRIEDVQEKQTRALMDLNKRMAEHVKTGK